MITHTAGGYVRRNVPSFVRGSCIVIVVGGSPSMEEVPNRVSFTKLACGCSSSAKRGINRRLSEISPVTMTLCPIRSSRRGVVVG